MLNFVLLAALGNLGLVLVASGQSDEALPLMKRCLSISREHLSGNHLDLAEGEIVYNILVVLLAPFLDYIPVAFSPL